MILRTHTLHLMQTFQDILDKICHFDREELNLDIKKKGNGRDENILVLLFGGHISSIKKCSASSCVFL